MKTRPETLLCGSPDLAIESSGTSGRVSRVYLSRRELEYNARQGGVLCGLPFRRLSALRGRVDEQVSSAWGNVHPEFFEPLLAAVRGLGPDWQVALYERDLKPVFQFRLEVEGEREREDAVQVVVGELERRQPDAWDAYRRRLVDVEFCFFAPGALRGDGKLLRLTDERQTGPPPWLPRGQVLHCNSPLSCFGDT